MKRLFLLLLIIWYVHLINGEIIESKSINRDKFEAEYTVINLNNEKLFIPFTSVLYYYEKKEVEKKDEHKVK